MKLLSWPGSILFYLKEKFENSIYILPTFSRYKRLALLLVFLIAILITLLIICVYIFSILSFNELYPILNENWVFSNIEGILAIREFMLTLLLRGAPFLLTVTIAISTFLLNKYTQTSFKLLFKDSTLILLIIMGILNIIFHLAILFNLGNVTNIRSIKEATIIFYDTIIITLTLAVVTFIVLRIYTNAFPKVISDKFVRNIQRLSKDIDESLTSVNLNDHLNLKKGIETQIRLFANVTINAIKSKDYNTIRHNIEKIDEEIYNKLINYLESNPEKLEFEFVIDYVRKNAKKSEKNLDEVIDDIRIKSEEINNVIHDSVLNLYADIFESGLTNKEFYVCEKILEHKFSDINIEKSNNKNLVTGVYVSLFDLSLKYNKEGDTNSYYSHLLKDTNQLFNSNLDGFNKVLENFIDSAIKHNQPKILFFTLKTLKNNILNQIKKEKEKEKIIEMLFNKAIICLEEKRMSCFANFIRFLVTDGMALNDFKKYIEEIVNNKSVENYFDNLSELNRELEALEEETVEILDFFDEFDESLYEEEFVSLDNTYLVLKFFVVFFGYYLLQSEISEERINSEDRKIQISEELQNNIPNKTLRTVALDLETHLIEWDKLFVNQAEEYFKQVVQMLIKGSEKEILYEFTGRFNSSLLEKIAKK